MKRKELTKRFGEVLREDETITKERLPAQIEAHLKALERREKRAAKKDSGDKSRHKT